MDKASICNCPPTYITALHRTLSGVCFSFQQILFPHLVILEEGSQTEASGKSMLGVGSWGQLRWCVSTSSCISTLITGSHHDVNVRMAAKSLVAKFYRWWLCSLHPAKNSPSVSDVDILLKLRLPCASLMWFFFFSSRSSVLCCNFDNGIEFLFHLPMQANPQSPQLCPWFTLRALCCTFCWGRYAHSSEYPPRSLVCRDPVLPPLHLQHWSDESANPR